MLVCYFRRNNQTVPNENSHFFFFFFFYSSSSEFVTRVGRWAQWFVSTLVCRLPVVPPLGLYIHTSLKYHHTISLGLSRGRSPSTIPALAYCLHQSLIFHSALCDWTVSASSALSSLLCCVVFLLSHWLFCWWLYLSCTLSIFSGSSASQMLELSSWVCYPHSPCFSSVEQAGKHTADEHIYLGLGIGHSLRELLYKRQFAQKISFFISRVWNNTRRQCVIWQRCPR